LPQTIEMGEQIDYSKQKEFGGITTVFTVEKNGLPATEDDYKIMEGVITFKNKGDYKVTMKNQVLFTYDDMPTVIAEINVGVAEITKPTILNMETIVYPNPTTGELTIDNGEREIEKIEIFDITGKKLSFQYFITSEFYHKINTSNLTSGIYFIKINTKKGEIVKKIIKQ
jgi:hypothetical protein